MNLSLEAEVNHRPEGITHTHSTIALMLKNAKRTLDNDVFEDGTGRDVNGAVLGSHDDDGACSFVSKGSETKNSVILTLENDTTAKVNITSDCKMI